MIEPREGACLFVRSARGDGSGVITMPADMQQEAREIVLSHWTDWSLAYLWQCGHHRDELAHVAPSLRDALTQWWDVRNSFDKPGDAPQCFHQGKQWNVFWKPSTASIDGGKDLDDQLPDNDNDSERNIWQDGHLQGWDDAMIEVARQERVKRPNLRERLVSVFHRRKTGHDAR
jgi:hypothetical protein